MDKSLTTAQVVIDKKASKPSPTEESLGFWLDRFGSGESGSGPDYFRKLGLHALVWVTEGGGKCQVLGEVENDFEPGQAFLLFPDLPCRYFPKNKKWRTKWIVWGMASTLQSHRLIEPRPNLLTIDIRELDLLHRRLTHLPRTASSHQKLKEHQILCELFLAIQKSQSAKTEIGLVEQIEIEISKHLADEVKISALAQKFNISPPHLRRLFQSQTSLSPKQYLTSRRMMKAKELALDGYSIETIAERLGYADKFFFMRTFRTQTGITVETFRKANRL
jgi:AraC-like DNA-binding protein